MALIVAVINGLMSMALGKRPDVSWPCGLVGAVTWKVHTAKSQHSYCTNLVTMHNILAQHACGLIHRTYLCSFARVWGMGVRLRLQTSVVWRGWKGQLAAWHRHSGTAVEWCRWHTPLVGHVCQGQAEIVTRLTARLGKILQCSQMSCTAMSACSWLAFVLDCAWLRAALHSISIHESVVV